MERGGPRHIIGHDHIVVDKCSERSLFSEPGDSGSFVIDESANLVGLLVRGDEINDYCLFTLVDDLFADIINTTVALEVKLPPLSY